MAVAASSTLFAPGSPSEDSSASRSKLRTLTELAVGYLLIMVVIWMPRGRQRPFYIAAILWIAFVTILSFDGARTMGLRLASSLRSAWIIAAALLLSLAAMLVALRLHTLHLPDGPRDFVKLYIGYAIWACVQQFLLQDFFLLRLLRLLPTTTAAIVAAAAMFSLAHLPNPVLTPITAVWGFVACYLFLRYRNLYPLGIAHAILGISVALTIPGPIDHNMRVGLGYLHYHVHHHHYRSQNDQIVSTPACVIAEAPTLRSSRQALP